jgi:hypothetical protein
MGVDSPDHGTADSSSLVLAAEAPVMQRIKRVMTYMSRRGNSRIPNVVVKIVTEMLGELNEVPTPIVEFYTKQVAALLMWVSTGEADPDIPLPEDFVI